MGTCFEYECFACAECGEAEVSVEEFVSALDDFNDRELLKILEQAVGMLPTEALALIIRRSVADSLFFGRCVDYFDRAGLVLAKRRK